jgi:hypothetical protein
MRADIVKFNRKSFNPRNAEKVKCPVKVRNKITGETAEHVRNNNESIHLLIKLGVLEVVDATPAPGEMVRAQNGCMIPASAPPAEPRWYVGTMTTNCYSDQFDRVGTSKTIPCIVFEVGTTNKEAYMGEPEHAAQGFGKRTVPADILKQYAKAHKEFWKG